MKKKAVEKDYCTSFPEEVSGIVIRDCCKIHDNDCGERGTSSFFVTQAKFFKCIRGKLGLPWACVIGFGGGFFCGLKYPYFLYKKKKYQRSLNNAKR